MKKTLLLLILTLSICTYSCMNHPHSFQGKPGEIKLVTLDPGHFHAALVQKNMYSRIDSSVYVYAPAGADVDAHLDRIVGFNSRTENPTHWNEIVYKGDDFLQKMLDEHRGNVLVLAGNNQKKTSYIRAAIDAGYNVLSDKPMAINPASFLELQKAFTEAEKKKLLLYDIMTERFEITSILQKELSQMPALFGELEQGSVDNPAVIKESLHHFFKFVSGSALKRPAWFFDANQQGDGLVDVTTHLVDLVQWACFPQQVIDYNKDIILNTSRRWTSPLSLPQFHAITGEQAFPKYLGSSVHDSILEVSSNGEFTYTLKGVHVRVAVQWAYKAPEGAGDTHYSLMRGSKALLIIRQGAAQSFKPALYVEARDTNARTELEHALSKAIEKLQLQFEGLGMKKVKDGWELLIPEKYKLGHEAHFAQVMEKYLQYLQDGKLPEWEVPNMLAKYYTTTTALEMSVAGKAK